MKRLNWLIVSLLLTVIPTLQSCDDGDGYSIGDMGRDWATVRVIGGGTYYLDGDKWGTMWLGASSVWGYRPVDGERVVSYFNPLYDNFQGYDLAIKLEQIYPVLTKEVEDLTAENEAEYSNDPVVIWQNDMWIGGNYLNLLFQQNIPEKEKHRVSLVRNRMVEAPNDGYIHLEYRYNTYNDLSGYWMEGAVSFNLSSLTIDENTKGLKIKFKTSKGDEERVFNLKNTDVPKSVQDMDFSDIQVGKLK